MIEKEMDFEWNAKIALGSQGRAMSAEDFKKFVNYIKNYCVKTGQLNFQLQKMQAKKT